jgi:hypothetical protein
MIRRRTSNILGSLFDVTSHSLFDFDSLVSEST